MHKTKILSCLLAGVLVFSAAGCKKSPGPDTNAEKSAIIALDDWKKEDVNSLLDFIPENAQMAYISTRAYSSDSPFFKYYSAVGAEIFNDIETIISVSDSDFSKLLQESSKYLFDYYNILKPHKGLFSDYAKTAVSYGLHPKGIDSAVYFTDDIIVYKISAVDGSVLRKKYDEIYASLPADLKKYITSTDKKSGKYDVVELKIDPRIRELTMNEDQRELNRILMEYAGDAAEDIRAELHFDKSVVTLVIPYTDTADTSKAYKHAAKPIKLEAFGKLNANTAAVSYIDVEKVLKMPVVVDSLKEALDSTVSLDSLMKNLADTAEDNDNTENTDKCIADIQKFAGMTSKITSAVEIDSDHSVRVISNIPINDAPLMSQIKKMPTPRYKDIDDMDSLISVELSADMNIVTPIKDEMLKRLEASSCDSLKAAVSSFGTMAKIFIKDESTLKFISDSASLLSSVKGLTMSIGQMNHLRLRNFNFFGGIRGTDTGKMLKALWKDSAGVLTLPALPESDKVTEIELPELGKYNIYITNDTAAIASPNYAGIDKISTTAGKADGTLISLTYSISKLSQPIVAQLDPPRRGRNPNDAKVINALKSLLKMTTSIDGSIQLSVTDTGLQQIMRYQIGPSVKP